MIHIMYFVTLCACRTAYDRLPSLADYAVAFVALRLVQPTLVVIRILILLSCLIRIWK